MELLIIGNALMLVASIIMVCVGLQKDNNKAIALQTVQLGIMMCGEFLLGSTPGALSSIMSIARNILRCKHKLGTINKVILIAALSILSLLFNNIGWLVIIPIFATALFTWLIDTDDVITMKTLIIVTSLCWIIHDAYIQAYTVLPFDIITAATTAISLFAYQRTKTTKTAIA